MISPHVSPKVRKPAILVPVGKFMHFSIKFNSVVSECRLGPLADLVAGGEGEWERRWETRGISDMVVGR